MPDLSDLRYELTVAAAPHLVYRYWINSTALREWLCDVATTAPRLDGHCFFGWNGGYYAAGHYLDLQPNRKVVFTWQGKDEPGRTRVDVDLEPAGEGTRVLLCHMGFGDDARWEATRQACDRAWQSLLPNLASVLETGEDRRFTQRPMLGIGVSDFDADVATRLGVPVTTGVRLDAVVDGMGAAAAGLQAGDVIVAMDGAPIVDWASMTAILQKHRAGESVPLAFYRGPERGSTVLTLSGRPLPALPATLPELASALRDRYARQQADLDAFLAPLDESIAEFRPDGEWSVKDALAHLIHSERGFQQYIGELSTGSLPQYDDWGGNVQARNAATVSAHPELADLSGELKRLRQETVALLEALPAEWTSRKGSYWQLAYGIVEGSYDHQSVHLEQMQAAVAAAREG